MNKSIPSLFSSFADPGTAGMQYLYTHL
uniref:Uncharacterized protein n=1 Tax=Arundo donax TaxID=35708 RepID=A0A0A9BJW3_ARUDO